ncbi:helix-turn-helix domain-containing protein [Neptunicella sp. SCSIO 80796]|uniref:helix-turn-helix domain-containing protein n=1 Tax=Neptunicella plasticusilytica TaxID=3117012 RepID=UPI003A4DA2F1
MKLRQRLHHTQHIPRHRHIQPYAAVVLAGGYMEAGDHGRWRVSAGDVLIHAPFSSHMDRVTTAKTEVLNLSLSMQHAHLGGYWQLADPDVLVTLAEKDPTQARQALLQQIQPGNLGESDPVDQLARQLKLANPPAISEWAAQNGLRRETVFRQFQSAYGINPTQYRVEARSHQAWYQIVSSALSLADIAANLGFADQAHMSRAIKRISGFSPGYWRNLPQLQHSFKNLVTAP